MLTGFAIGLATGGGVSLAAESTAEPDVYRAVLPNGLRAIVRERPDTDVVAISVATRGGSRDERSETVGAAHFMEHMFFQGTPRRPDSADLNREIEARGGWSNAWTGWESINFQIVTPIEDLDLAIDVMADQIVNSSFAPEKIDKERQVVLEELNRRLNSPATKAYDLFWIEVFGDHPARNLPIGNRTTIDQSTREVLVEFRDTYFVASNLVVAVVGDIEHEVIFEKLRDAFANMRTGTAPPPNAAPVPPLVARIRVDTSPGQQARVIAGGPTVGRDSADRHILDVIEAILGNSGRRLERELVDTEAIASSAFAFYFPLTDVGVWGISVGCRPADVDRVIDLAKGQLREIRETPVAHMELDEAKAYLRGQRLLHRERSVDLAEELSDGEALGSYEPLATYLSRIETVTAADIQRVANAYLDPDRLTLTILRP
jgi:predicted Zn-dependent peptidase